MRLVKKTSGSNSLSLGLAELSQMPAQSTAKKTSDTSHSFVVRVSPRDVARDGPTKLSIRIVHVNGNVTRRFSSTKTAFKFIADAIDQFVLQPLH
jgi:hypothetical protein